MKLRNSLTPYPILCAYNDDYRDSSFKADIQCSYSAEKVKLIVTFQLENEELEHLLSEGKVKYLVHVESPKISFRKEYETIEKQIQIILDKDAVTDSIQVCTFIVANENMQDYHNALFNELDTGLHISLARGNTIAIGPAKELFLEKNSKELCDAESLIKIVKNAKDKKASLYVNTDEEEYILIGIDAALYDLYWKLGKRKYKEVIFSLVLLPAFITILTRMKKDNESDEDSQFEGKEWYTAILDLLDQADYSLDDLKEEDNSILEAVQVIFRNPIKKALNALDANDGEEEEE